MTEQKKKRAWAERLPWRDEDVALLRELYPNHSREYCAKVLRRSVDAVGMKASKLGLKRQGYPQGERGHIGHTWHPWTAEDDARLREIYPVLGTRATAEALGVTPRAVMCRAHAMRLRVSRERASQAIKEGLLNRQQALAKQLPLPGQLAKKGYQVVAFWDGYTARDFALEDMAAEAGIKVVPEGCDYKAYRTR